MQAVEAVLFVVMYYSKLVSFGDKWSCCALDKGILVKEYLHARVVGWDKSMCLRALREGLGKGLGKGLGDCELFEYMSRCSRSPMGLTTGILPKTRS